MIEARNTDLLKDFGSNKKFITKHPVKFTALLYLKEALLSESYEGCAEFIEIAKEFGAQDFEVQYILEDPRRKPT